MAIIDVIQLCSIWTTFIYLTLQYVYRLETRLHPEGMPANEDL